MNRNCITGGNPSALTSKGHHFRAGALLLILIALIYSNSYTAGWHYDDYANITRNRSIQIDNLYPDTLWQVVRENSIAGRIMNRPVAYLSLALNWFFGEDSVFGYHLLNNLIHGLAAVVLYVTINVLFHTPALRNSSRHERHFIALLAATFWALNPIQTQAVVYIVQRMASMCALFYLLAVYFYLKGRLAVSNGRRYGYYSGCFLSFLAALGTKENAASLPLALIAMEWLFFFPDKRLRALWPWLATLSAVIVLGAGMVWIYIDGDLSAVFVDYQARPFTPWQRLLSQLRVVTYYLSQIFYPVPTRLSVNHTLTISTSLWSPWTTFTSLLLICFLLAAGFSQARSRPLVSFAILFFFINQLIESTVLPLELIEEHRNYLPSAFLFLPIAQGIKWLFDYYRHRNRSIHRLLPIFICLLLVGLGCGTYIRNMAWATEKSLWEDAIRKAPSSSRAYHNLAWGHYQRQGRYREALKLYHRALSLTHDNFRYHRMKILQNMAAIFYLQGAYPEARQLYERAHNIKPSYGPVVLQLVRTLIRMGHLKEGKVYLEKLLKLQPNTTAALDLMGFIYLKTEQPLQAIDYLRLSHRQNPAATETLLYLCMAHSILGNHDRAIWFIRLASQMNARAPLLHLYMAELGRRSRNPKMINRSVNRFVAQLSIDQARSFCEDLLAENQALLFDPEPIVMLVAGKMRLADVAMGM